MPDLHNTDAFDEKDEDFKRFAAARGIGPDPSAMLRNPDHTPGAVLGAAMAGVGINDGVMPGGVPGMAQMMSAPTGKVSKRPPKNASKILSKEDMVALMAEQENTQPASMPVATDNAQHMVQVDPREVGYALEVALAERNGVQSELTVMKGRVAYLQDVVKAQNEAITELRAQLATAKGEDAPPAGPDAVQAQEGQQPE